MIKKNKLKLLISSILIILPCFVGLALWNKLPDSMMMHWGADGEADGFGSKAFVVFGMPLILLAFHLLCVFIMAKDPKNKDQSGKVFGIIFYIMPLTSFVTSFITYMFSLGKPVGLSALLCIFLGIVFIVIGNYLPKCKQNYTIGIKIKWTLANEENWNATHRFSGKMWVACGILLLLCSFIPTKYFMWILIPCVLLAVIPTYIYSFLYYKKQVKEGRAPEKPQYSYAKRDRYILISVICGLVVLFAILIPITFMGSIEMVYGEEAFTVEASYFNDITVRYDEIADIEFRESFDKGTREYGFGSPRLSMGSFRNEEFGKYSIISYTGCDAAVIITSNEGDKLVLNCSDEAETKAFYEALLERTEADE